MVKRAQPQDEPEPIRGRTLFEDGLGTRVVDVSSPDGLEYLVLAPALAAYENALKDRVSRLLNFRHVRYPRVRAVERYGPAQGGSVVVACDRIVGVRLSDVLAATERGDVVLDVNAALQIARELLPAIGVLHDSRNVTHGALGLERVVLNGLGRIAITDHTIGLALAKMQYARLRLWREFRIAMPPSAGLPRFDHRADIAQVGLLSLALVAGRPLRLNDFPDGQRKLLDEARETLASGTQRPLAPSLRSWFESALPLDTRRPYGTALEAQVGLEEAIKRERAYAPAPSALKAFVQRYAAARPGAFEEAPACDTDLVILDRAQGVTVTAARPSAEAAPAAGIPSGRRRQSTRQAHAPTPEEEEAEEIRHLEATLARLAAEEQQRRPVEATPIEIEPSVVTAAAAAEQGTTPGAVAPASEPIASEPVAPAPAAAPAVPRAQESDPRVTDVAGLGSDRAIDAEGEDDEIRALEAMLAELALDEQTAAANAPPQADAPFGESTPQASPAIAAADLNVPSATASHPQISDDEADEIRALEEALSRLALEGTSPESEGARAEADGAAEARLPTPRVASGLPLGRVELADHASAGAWRHDPAFAPAHSDGPGRAADARESAPLEEVLDTAALLALEAELDARADAAAVAEPIRRLDEASLEGIERTVVIESLPCEDEVVLEGRATGTDDVILEHVPFELDLAGEVQRLAAPADEAEAPASLYVLDATAIEPLAADAPADEAEAPAPLYVLDATAIEPLAADAPADEPRAREAPGDSGTAVEEAFDLSAFVALAVEACGIVTNAASPAEALRAPAAIDAIADVDTHVDVDLDVPRPAQLVVDSHEPIDEATDPAAASPIADAGASSPSPDAPAIGIDERFTGSAPISDAAETAVETTQEAAGESAVALPVLRIVRQTGPAEAPLEVAAPVGDVSIDAGAGIATGPDPVARGVGPVAAPVSRAHGPAERQIRARPAGVPRVAMPRILGGRGPLRRRFAPVLPKALPPRPEPRAALPERAMPVEAQIAIRPVATYARAAHSSATPLPATVVARQVRTDPRVLRRPAPAALAEHATPVACGVAVFTPATLAQTARAAPATLVAALAGLRAKAAPGARQSPSLGLPERASPVVCGIACRAEASALDRVLPAASREQVALLAALTTLRTSATAYARPAPAPGLPEHASAVACGVARRHEASALDRALPAASREQVALLAALTTLRTSATAYARPAPAPGLPERASAVSCAVACRPEASALDRALPIASRDVVASLATWPHARMAWSPARAAATALAERVAQGEAAMACRAPVTAFDASLAGAPASLVGALAVVFRVEQAVASGLLDLDGTEEFDESSDLATDTAGVEQGELTGELSAVALSDAERVAEATPDSETGAWDLADAAPSDVQEQAHLALDLAVSELLVEAAPTSLPDLVAIASAHAVAAPEASEGVPDQAFHVAVESAAIASRASELEPTVLEDARSDEPALDAVTLVDEAVETIALTGPALVADLPVESAAIASRASELEPTVLESARSDEPALDAVTLVDEAVETIAPTGPALVADRHVESAAIASHASELEPTVLESARLDEPALDAVTLVDEAVETIALTGPALVADLRVESAAIASHASELEPTVLESARSDEPALDAVTLVDEAVETIALAAPAAWATLAPLAAAVEIVQTASPLAAAAEAASVPAVLAPASEGPASGPATSPPEPMVATTPLARETEIEPAVLDEQDDTSESGTGSPEAIVETVTRRDAPRPKRRRSRGKKRPATTPTVMQEVSPAFAGASPARRTPEVVPTVVAVVAPWKRGGSLPPVPPVDAHDAWLPSPGVTPLDEASFAIAPAVTSQVTAAAPAPAAGPRPIRNDSWPSERARIPAQPPAGAPVSPSAGMGPKGAPVDSRLSPSSVEAFAVASAAQASAAPPQPAREVRRLSPPRGLFADVATDSDAAAASDDAGAPEAGARVLSFPGRLFGRRINWRRTAAACFVVVLLEGVAFAAMYWFVKPSELGTLLVQTNTAGIEVLIDGRSSGKAPMSLNLKPGRHTIEMRGNGLSKVLPVEIAAGVQTTQYVKWSHTATGSVRLTSTPPGARVTVGNQLKGMTPILIEGLPAGTQTLLVESDRGSVRANVEVKADQTTDLDVPIYSGWVEIYAPVELRIFLQGRLLGTTMDGKLLVPPGTQELDLVNKELGFRERRKVEIQPGATLTVSVEPPKGSIVVVAPDGTEVLVEGKPVGTAPLADKVPVPIGLRDIELKPPHLAPRKFQKTIGLGAPVKVDFMAPQ